MKSHRDALVQLQNTRLAISRLFVTITNEIKGFKFVETLKVTFVKKKDGDYIVRQPILIVGRKLYLILMIFYQAYNYHNSNY